MNFNKRFFDCLFDEARRGGYKKPLGPRREGRAMKLKLLKDFIDMYLMRGCR